MRRRDRWVGWSRLDDPPKLRWIPDARASDTDMSSPASWVSWELAQGYAQPRAFRRRGFVLGGGVGCITIGGCVNEDGVVDPAVQRWLREFDSFAEITWTNADVQVAVLTGESPPLELAIAGHNAVVTSTPDRWIPLTGRRVGRSQVARRWVGRIAPAPVH